MKHILKNITKTTNNSHLNMYVANYELPNKQVLNYQFATRRKESELSLVTHNHTKVDAVKVLPYTVNENNQISLVFIQEFRHPIGDYIFSLPAGLVDDGENPQDAAVRELMEETGAITHNIWLAEPNSYISVGMSDESMECYVAQVTLTPNTATTVHEDIAKIVTVPIGEAMAFLQTNRLDLQTRLLVKNFILENK